jgi:hypothetical protein
VVCNKEQTKLEPTKLQQASSVSSLLTEKDKQASPHPARRPSTDRTDEETKVTSKLVLLVSKLLVTAHDDTTRHDTTTFELAVAVAQAFCEK